MESCTLFQLRAKILPDSRTKEEGNKINKRKIKSGMIENEARQLHAPV